MNKAVFLDRDGVINKEKKDYVKNVSELEIFSEVKNIKLLKDAGFLVIVISNQSAINRGLTTSKHVDLIHDSIQNFLKTNGTQIDAFFYCPHQPNENCNCRKPKSGLFLEASKKMNIDLTLSWMIGDSETDIRAGKSALCRTILLSNSYTLKDAINQILIS